jgi:hypothetical protein
MSPAGPSPDDLHEFVSFNDPEEERTWVFDVTFLTSNYRCIFGQGCKGVFEDDQTALMHGCCSHGAHLTDKADRKKLVRFAETLTDDQWELKHVADERGGDFLKRIAKKNEDGVYVTRVVDDACIFLNRPGWKNGPGCALHQAAVAAGERPLDWKPEVCWQLPIRRLDEVDPYDRVTTTIREWKRRDWGAGGEEFHWWCTDSREAFVDAKPVWQTMRDELVEMCGEQVYGQLASYLRAKQRSNVTFLPHPKSKRRSTRTPSSEQE